MKIEDMCDYRLGDKMLSYDTKAIADAIKSRDNEFLVDLYFKNSVYSRIEKLIVCLLIEELLGYDPYDST